MDQYYDLLKNNKGLKIKLEYIIPKKDNSSEIIGFIIKNEEEYYIKICYQKINTSLALNLLYKKVSHNHNEMVKSNYKSDAKLVLDKVKK